MHKKYPMNNFIYRIHEWALLRTSFNQWWVWIFEYSKNITLEYYSYSYSCYFRKMNIFGYLFGKYIASEYIRILIRYIIWHPNIFGYLFVSILWYLLITEWQPVWEITRPAQLPRCFLYFSVRSCWVGWWFLSLCQLQTHSDSQYERSLGMQSNPGASCTLVCGPAW